VHDAYAASIQAQAQVHTRHRQISAIPEAPDSRYTSTRSEDLRETQKLFGADNMIDLTASVTDEKSFESSTVSSRHSKLASFFRRCLSRKFSKSKAQQPDPEKVKQAKTEIRVNLLNEQGPDAGGYVSDAAVLEDVDVPSTPRRIHQEYQPGGRSKARQSLQYQTWSGPLGSQSVTTSFCNLQS
jgi:hypothetical protein